MLKTKWGYPDDIPQTLLICKRRELTKLMCEEKISYRTAEAFLHVYIEQYLFDRGTPLNPLYPCHDGCVLCLSNNRL